MNAGSSRVQTLITCAVFCVSMEFVILAGGIVVALLGIFAWPVMRKLPSHRMRASMLSDQAARILVVVGGICIAVIGGAMVALD